MGDEEWKRLGRETERKGKDRNRMDREKGGEWNLGRCIVSFRGTDAPGYGTGYMNAC